MLRTFTILLIFFQQRTAKMKTVAALTLLASASAFAPVLVQKPATAFGVTIDEAFGVSIETWNKYSPLGAAILEHQNQA